MPKEKKEIIIWRPAEESSPSVPKYGWSLFYIRRRILNPEYPPERQEDLLILCDLYQVALESGVDSKIVTELGTLILEEVGLINVRPERGLDLRPAA